MNDSIMVDAILLVKLNETVGHRARSQLSLTQIYSEI